MLKNPGKHLKKIVAPAVVTICIACYYAVYGVIIVKLNIPNFIKIIVLIFSVIITAVLISVFIERVREINEGEEDDISKY